MHLKFPFVEISFATSSVVIVLYGTKYSRVEQVKFFKSCLPQILLGPLLNTLSHIREQNES